MHFYLQNAAALARLAAPALDVKAEPSGTVAAHFGVLRVGKQAADVPEHACVGGGVGARCAPDGRLVNADDLVHPFHALDLLALTGAAAGAVQGGCQRFVQNFIDQRGFSRTRHTGNTNHLAQREVHRNVLQVVFPRLDNAQHLAVAFPSDGRDLDKFASRQVRARDAALRLADIGNAARRHDLAAVYARAGTDIDNIVRLTHGVLVMLDNDQRVAEVAQTLHSGDQLVVVALVQADARLVQHIQNARQRAADLCRQPDALAFAAGQRCRPAGQRQVAKTHALQKAQTLLDFLKNGRTDALILGADLSSPDKLEFVIDALVAEIGNIDAAHRHRKAGGL